MYDINPGLLTHRLEKLAESITTVREKLAVDQAAMDADDAAQAAWDMATKHQRKSIKKPGFRPRGSCVFPG
jgi:hypothetical protein